MLWYVAAGDVRQGLHGSDLFVQHIPQVLNLIQIWAIWRSSQDFKHAAASRTILEPSFMYLKEANGFSQQNVAQSITLPQPTCLLSIVYHVARCVPGK